MSREKVKNHEYSFDISDSYHHAHAVPTYSYRILSVLRSNFFKGKHHVVKIFVLSLFLRARFEFEYFAYRSLDTDEIGTKR